LPVTQPYVSQAQYSLRHFLIDRQNTNALSKPVVVAAETHYWSS